MDVFCLSSFLLSSQLISSLVSVVFDFNVSLNDVAPASPILLPVDTKRKEKSELLILVICVFFLLYSLPRFSSVSVVFDFSASLSDVAPVSPTLFPVDVNRKEKSELLMNVFYVYSFFCLHHPDRVQ